MEKKYLKIHKICDNKKKSNSVWPYVCRIFVFFSHNKMNRIFKQKNYEKKTKNLLGNVK